MFGTFSNHLKQIKVVAATSQGTHGANRTRGEEDQSWVEVLEVTVEAFLGGTSKTADNDNMRFCTLRFILSIDFVVESCLTVLFWRLLDKTNVFWGGSILKTDTTSKDSA